MSDVLVLGLDSFGGRLYCARQRENHPSNGQAVRTEEVDHSNGERRHTQNLKPLSLVGSLAGSANTKEHGAISSRLSLDRE